MPLTASVGLATLAAIAGLLVGPHLPGLVLPVLVLVSVPGAPELVYVTLSTYLQHNTRSEFRATSMSIAEGCFSIQMLWLFPLVGYVVQHAGYGIGLRPLRGRSWRPARRSSSPPSGCRASSRRRRPPRVRPMPQGRKLIAENRKARHDFHILERVEAGVALQGTEVKSLRDGGGNLRDAFAQLRDGEVFLVGANIAPYRQGNIQNHEPLRDRKLLLHRREIGQLGKKVAERGMTLVPLALYFSDGRVKVELGLAKGKEGVDKRRAVADRDARRADRPGPARRRERSPNR